MVRLFIALFTLGLLVCPCVRAAAAEPKLADLQKKLSPEQMRLFHEFVELHVQMGARLADANNPGPTRLQFQAAFADEFAKMSPEQAKVVWRDLPRTLTKEFRMLDPLHVSAEERKAAERLPAAAKDHIAKLLSDDVDEVLAARRRILVYGPGCRLLIVDQLSKLPLKSPKRPRHEELLKFLNSEEGHEWRLGIIEPVLKKASQLEKDRKNATSTIGVVFPRRVCDVGKHPSEDRGYQLEYYNFLNGNHDYTGGAGLSFGNGEGNRLNVNFYGGQDNRITDLGDVKYADIQKAPGAAQRAKWDNGRNPGQPVTAVLSHVYLLHLHEKRDNINFTVKFRVVEMSSDEWIIIEWERIPQDN